MPTSALDLLNAANASNSSTDASSNATDSGLKPETVSQPEQAPVVAPAIDVQSNSTVSKPKPPAKKPVSSTPPARPLAASTVAPTPAKPSNPSPGVAAQPAPVVAKPTGWRDAASQLGGAPSMIKSDSANPTKAPTVRLSQEATPDAQPVTLETANKFGARMKGYGSIAQQNVERGLNEAESKAAYEMPDINVKDILDDAQRVRGAKDAMNEMLKRAQTAPGLEDETPAQKYARAVAEVKAMPEYKRLEELSQRTEDQILNDAAKRNKVTRSMMESALLQRDVPISDLTHRILNTDVREEATTDHTLHMWSQRTGLDASTAGSQATGKDINRYEDARKLAIQNLQLGRVEYNMTPDAGLTAEDANDSGFTNKPGEVGFAIAQQIVNEYLKTGGTTQWFNPMEQTHRGYQDFLKTRVNDLLTKQGMTPDKDGYDAAFKSAVNRAIAELAAAKTVGLWTSPIFLPKNLDYKSASWGDAIVPGLEIVGESIRKDGSIHIVTRQETPFAYTLNTAQAIESAGAGALRRLKEDTSEGSEQAAETKDISKMARAPFMLPFAIWGLATNKSDKEVVAKYLDAEVGARRGVLRRDNLFELGMQLDWAQPNVEVDPTTGEVQRSDDWHMWVAGGGGLVASMVTPDLFGAAGEAVTGGAHLVSAGLDASKARAAAKILDDITVKRAAAQNLYEQARDVLEASREAEGITKSTLAGRHIELLNQAQQSWDHASRLEGELRDAFPHLADELDRYDSAIATNVSPEHPELFDRDLANRIPIKEQPELSMHPSSRRADLKSGGETNVQYAYKRLYDTGGNLQALDRVQLADESVLAAERLAENSKRRLARLEELAGEHGADIRKDLKAALEDPDAWSQKYLSARSGVAALNRSEQDIRRSIESAIQTRIHGLQRESASLWEKLSDVQEQLVKRRVDDAALTAAGINLEDAHKLYDNSRMIKELSAPDYLEKTVQSAVEAQKAKRVEYAEQILMVARNARGINAKAADFAKARSALLLSNETRAASAEVLRLRLMAEKHLAGNPYSAIVRAKGEIGRVAQALHESNLPREALPPVRPLLERIGNFVRAHYAGLVETSPELGGKHIKPSAAGKAFGKKFAKHFNLDKAQQAVVVDLAESHARVWAELNGKTVDEWYKTHIAGIFNGFTGEKTKLGKLSLKRLQKSETFRKYVEDLREYNYLVSVAKPVKAQAERLEELRKLYPELASASGEVKISKLSDKWLKDKKAAYSEKLPPRVSKKLRRESALYQDYAQSLKDRGIDLDRLAVPRGFFSPLQRAIRIGFEKSGQEFMKPSYLLSIIRKSPGVKADEIAWSGIEEFLDEAQRVGKRVSMDDVVDWLGSREPVVVVKGAEGFTSEEYARIQRLGQAVHEANQRAFDAKNALAAAQRKIIARVNDAIGDYIDDCIDDFDVGDLKFRLSPRFKDEFQAIQDDIVESRRLSNAMSALAGANEAHAEVFNKMLRFGPYERSELLKVLTGGSSDSRGFTRILAKINSLPDQARNDLIDYLKLAAARDSRKSESQYAHAYALNALTDDEAQTLLRLVEANGEASRASYEARTALEQAKAESNVPQPAYATLVLPGKRENYREIRFIQPSGSDPYSAQHFEPGTFAHLRTTDRMTKDGKKVLFVEEIQSDWHQAGAKYGYVDEAAIKEAENLRQRNREINDRLRQLADDWDHVDFDDFSKEQEAEIVRLRAETDRLHDEQDKITDRIESLSQDRKVQPGTHSDTWTRLALQQALNIAAEEGYDGIAINRGVGSVATVGGKIKGQADFYDRVVPQTLKKYVNGLTQGKGELQTTVLAITPEEIRNGMDKALANVAAARDLAAETPDATFIAKGTTREKELAALDEMERAANEIKSRGEYEVSYAPISDKLRSKVEEGLPLYQKEKVPNGWTNIEVGIVDTGFKPGVAQKLLSTTSAKEAALIIAEGAESPSHRKLAARIAELMPDNVKWSADSEFIDKAAKNAGVESAAGASRPTGFYKGQSIPGHITINPERLTSEVAVHELTHQVTQNQLYRLAHNIEDLSDYDRQLLEDIKALYGKARESLDTDEHYGLKNVSEFIAEGMSNPRFQDALRGIKLEDETLWQKLKNIVYRLLGKESDTPTVASELEQAVYELMESRPEAEDIVKQRAEEYLSAPDSMKKFMEGPYFQDDEQIKGKLGFDKKRIVELLGASMYRGSAAEVTIKELLQNAFDAVKAAQVKGQIKKAFINVTVDRVSRKIVMQDNGVGMTPDIVQKAFFTIAGTDKSDLPPHLRSGGLGLAKMAFLMSAETLEINTVRDGIRTIVKTTPEEILNDNFVLHTSRVSSDVKPGTRVSVTIPKNYVDREGNLQEIYFPWDAVSGTALGKPLLGDVEVKLKEISYPGSEGDIRTLPLGVHSDLSSYHPPKKVKFSWGEADVYVGKERKEYSQGLVLSSGVPQFEPDMWSGNERYPYDVLINVKPSVPADHPHYPFNNQRESWKPSVEKDIKALNKYLADIARGESAKATANVFASAVSMKRVGLNELGGDLESARKAILAGFEPKAESKAVEAAENASKPESLVIDDGKITSINDKPVAASPGSEHATSGKIQAESITPAQRYFESMKVDPKKPLYLNNTNVDYVAETKKINPKAEPEAFLSQLGSLVVEFRERAAKAGGYGYEVLDAPGVVYASGIAIDKKYRGVHVKVPYKAFFINPLALSGKSPVGVAEGALHAMMHEATHTLDMQHGESFAIKLADLYERMGDSADVQAFRTALQNVFSANWQTYVEMRGIYGRSATKNLAKSMEDGAKLGTGSAGRTATDIAGSHLDDAGGELSRIGDEAIEGGAGNVERGPAEGVDDARAVAISHLERMADRAEYRPRESVIEALRKRHEAEFKDLADRQRGTPESMFNGMRNPGSNHSGVYQWAMEHTGDLAHRAADQYGADAGIPQVREKIRKLKRFAENAEHADSPARQAARNYDHLAGPEGLAKYPEEIKYYPNPEVLSSKQAFIDAMNDAGLRYSQEYRKLLQNTPRPTMLQRLGAEAAIALGKQDWPMYRLTLDAMDKLLNEAAERGSIDALYYAHDKDEFEKLSRYLSGKKKFYQLGEPLDEARKITDEFGDEFPLPDAETVPAGAKGAVQFLQDGRAIVFAFRNPDVSTAVHELGHIMRRDLPDEDLKIIEEWVGVINRQWTVDAEEKFARGFEKYLYDGKAPTSLLDRAFAKLKTWMRSIYSSLTSSPIDYHIPDEVRGVYDRLLGFGSETTKTLEDALNSGPPSAIEKIVADLASKGVNVDAEDLYKQFENGQTILLDEKALGKKAWTPADVSRLQDQLDSAATMAAGPKQPSLSLDARRAQTVESEPVEAARSFVSSKVPPDSPAAIAANAAMAVMFGGDAEEMYRHLPPTLRKGIAAASRLVSAAFNDASTLAHETGLNTLIKYLGGERVAYRAGRDVASSGYNFASNIINSFNKYWAELPEGTRAIIQAFAFNEFPEKVARHEIVGNAVDDFLYATRMGRKKPPQWLAEMLDVVGAVNIRSARAGANVSDVERQFIALLLNFTGNAPDTKMSLPERVAKVKKAGKVDADVAKANRLDYLLSGIDDTDPNVGMMSVEDAFKPLDTPSNIHGADPIAVGEFLKGVTQIFDEDAARKAGILIAAFGSEKRAYDALFDVGATLSDADTKIFLRRLNSEHLPPGLMKRADEIMEKFGVNPYFKDPGGEAFELADDGSYVVPATARNRIQGQLKSYAEQLAKKDENSPLARAGENILRNAFKYMHGRMVKGGFFAKPRQYWNQTFDIFNGVFDVSGLRPAIVATCRTMAQQVLAWELIPSIPGTEVARILHTAQLVTGGTKLGEVPILTKTSKAIQAGSDEAARFIGKLLALSKYRAEVNKIVEGADETIKLGGRTYTYKHLREIALQEGIFSNVQHAYISQVEGAAPSIEAANKRASALRQKLNELGNAASYHTERLFEVPEEIMELWGNSERVGIYATYIEAGMAPRDAARLAIKSQFDYGYSMSKFDRSLWVKMLVPFWPFQKNANILVANLMLSPAGWYRLGVMNKFWKYGADMLTGLDYRGETDPYGIDIDALPPDQLERYWALRLGVESAFKGARNVPEEVSLMMRMGFSNQATITVDGQLRKANEYYQQMLRDQYVDGFEGPQREEILPFRSINTTGAYQPQPEKSVRSGYLRDRDVIRLTPDMSYGDAVYKYYTAAHPNHPMTELVIPDHIYRSAMRWFTYFNAGAILAAEKMLTSGGIDVLGDEDDGMEYVLTSTPVAEIIDPTKAPITADMLDWFNANPKGRMPKRVSPKLAALVENWLPIDLMRTSPEADPFTTSHDDSSMVSAMDKEMYSKLFEAEPNTDVEVANTPMQLKNVRYYMAPGPGSMIFYMSPIGELNEKYLAMEKTPLEENQGTWGDLLAWARGVVGVQTAEEGTGYEANRTAGHEETEFTDTNRKPDAKK